VFITSSFEDAETEIVNYVTEGIDIEDIRAALADSILAYYDKKKNVMSQEKTVGQNHGWRINYFLKTIFSKLRKEME